MHRENMNSNVGAGRCASGMYSANLQCASDKKKASLDVTGDILSVWHARLTPLKRNAIYKKVQSGAVQGMETVEERSANDYLSCV